MSEVLREEPRPVEALENVGGEPLQCLRRTTPQHTVGADHLEEDAVPTQAIRFVQCTCA